MSSQDDPRRPAPSLDRLREQVRARVNATSLKHVARAVGMSPGALERFLNRGPIVGRSRSNLFHWLTRTEAQADADAAACAQLIHALVAHMAPDAQIRAAGAIVDALLKEHERSNPGGVPLWLERLAAVPKLFLD
jgi:AcrR family transcriptional regulator